MGAFCGSSLSPSCSWIAVKIDGAVESVDSLAAGVNCSVKSYFPVRPVLSTTGRSSSRVNSAGRKSSVLPVASISPLSFIRIIGVPDSPGFHSFSLVPFFATTSA